MDSSRKFAVEMEIMLSKPSLLEKMGFASDESPTYDEVEARTQSMHSEVEEYLPPSAYRDELVQRIADLGHQAQSKLQLRKPSEIEDQIPQKHDPADSIAEAIFIPICKRSFRYRIKLALIIFGASACFWSQADLAIRAMAILVGGTCGLAAVLAFLKMRDASAGVVLDAEGIEMNISSPCLGRIFWEEIERIDIIQDAYAHRRSISIILNEPSAFWSRGGFALRMSKWIYTKLEGYDKFKLEYSMLDMNFNEIGREVMNRFKIYKSTSIDRS